MELVGLKRRGRTAHRDELRLRGGEVIDSPCGCRTADLLGALTSRLHALRDAAGDRHDIAVEGAVAPRGERDLLAVRADARERVLAQMTELIEKAHGTNRGEVQ